MARVQLELLSDEQLEDFATALLTNASSLLVDAARLLKYKSCARSLSLSILASEELAKVVVVNVSKLKTNPKSNEYFADARQFLTNHRDKLALSLGLGHFSEKVLNQLSASVEAHLHGKTPPPRDVITFKPADRKTKGHEVNIQKQNGFYVDFNGSTFTTPAQTVTYQMAADMLMDTGQALFFAAFLNAFFTAELRDTPQPLVCALEQAIEIYSCHFSSIATADLTK